MQRRDRLVLKYRKATGRDSKIRLKMRGHMRNVSIGFRTNRNGRGLINGLKPVLIHNVKELNEIKEDELVIVASIGARKKLEIAKVAQEKNIELHNLNPKKFIKTIEAKIKKSKEKKKTLEVKKEKSKKESEKKAKEKEEAEKKEKKDSEKKDEGKEDVEKKDEGKEDSGKKDEGKEDVEKKDEGKKGEKSEVKVKEIKSKDNKKTELSNNYGRGN